MDHTESDYQEDFYTEYEDWGAFIGKYVGSFYGAYKGIEAASSMPSAGIPADVAKYTAVVGGGTVLGLFVGEAFGLFAGDILEDTKEAAKHGGKKTYEALQSAFGEEEMSDEDLGPKKIIRMPDDISEEEYIQGDVDLEKYDMKE